MARKKKVSTLDLPLYRVTTLYIGLTLGWLIAYVFLRYFWSELMIVNLSDLLKPDASIVKGLAAVWFIFLWAVVITLIIGIYNKDEPIQVTPEEILLKGWWISLNAGIFEEIIFRWLAFCCALVTLPFFNLITFGLVRWLYVQVLIPLANWATLGALSPQLLGSDSWVIGAAIVSANGDFRDGHSGSGWSGFINSWFIGMVMFYLVFNYGLVTAIVAHVIYDILVFTAAALAATWRPREYRLAAWR
jgi:hypothetical protein